jgi:rod shape determining protein RodA
VIAQARSVRFDWILLATVLVVCGLGILNLSSIPGSYATGRYLKQVYWLAIGLVAALAVWRLDYRIFARLAYPLYAITLGLLVLVLVAPESIAPITKGAKRWLFIGGHKFQPSELAKLAVILVLARHFHVHPPGRGGYGLVQLAFPFVLLLAPVGLILRQPDLGTALLLVAIGGTMILFARMRWTAIVSVVLVAAVALPIVWHFGLNDYQRDRVYSLFNPEVDQKKKGWQSRQAVIATSSGQLTGKGFRQGTQTQYGYVPEQWNDFAFSGWAEEWGFLGCFFLLALYYFLIVWSLSISSHARERLGAFLAVGVGAMLFWHVIVNVGMVTRLLPVVGIPLPFFSYGGSSLLTMMVGVGLLLAVSAHRT